MTGMKMSVQKFDIEGFVTDILKFLRALRFGSWKEVEERNLLEYRRCQ